MKTFLQKWNIMRMLRLILGTGILIQGITARDTATIILGAAFAVMAFANIGCCGATSCAVNPRNTNKKTENIHYEEMVSNK